MSPFPNDGMESEEIREGDILFECPYCEKSMAIESAGAGLMVPCASCGKSVQVPIPDYRSADVPPAAIPRPSALPDTPPADVIRQLDAALALANSQIERLIGEKEGLQERRAFLEQVRMANNSRLEHLADELAQVQEALDRALVLLADARAEKPA